MCNVQSDSTWRTRDADDVAKTGVPRQNPLVHFRSLRVALANHVGVTVVVRGLNYRPRHSHSRLTMIAVVLINNKVNVSYKSWLSKLRVHAQYDQNGGRHGGSIQMSRSYSEHVSESQLTFSARTDKGTRASIMQVQKIMVQEHSYYQNPGRLRQGSNDYVLYYQNQYCLHSMQ